MKKGRSNKTKKNEWNLKHLYSSPTDPQIEKDVSSLEKSVSSFASNYNTPHKEYLLDAGSLLKALNDYEELAAKASPKFLMYFYFLRDTEASNTVAASNISLLENRFAQIDNVIAFFRLALGQISEDKQHEFLNNPKLEHFRIFLKRIFDDAKHNLSLAEEKIMNLKSIPAHNMWESGNLKILNTKSVIWKKKSIPIEKALGMISQLRTPRERSLLSNIIVQTLKVVSPFSEAEMNAIVTNKKIDDDLRTFGKPYESTVMQYRNDPAVIENLVQTVTNNFHISHRFYALKARLLNLKKLSYSDRAAKIGIIRTKFDFDASVSILKKTFGNINMKYSVMFDEYLKEGRIDTFPRIGKKGGAYCWGVYDLPTYVLLNHSDDLHSFTTIAHEMGHAFHGELSEKQGPIYSSHSTSLAETASTLFESIALEAIYEKLSDKEKIIVLHDKINDDISTIFRQIACFNFEKDIHEGIRSKGFLSEKELAELHNKNMGAYLGPLFKMIPDDGYYFVQWSHIRHFFYVYSYAYGMLVSKALLRRYRTDKSYWKQIEQFLSAGGKESPENILKEIGIDTTKNDFWMDGLKEIEDDIKKLEDLTK